MAGLAQLGMVVFEVGRVGGNVLVAVVGYRAVSRVQDVESGPSGVLAGMP